MSGVDGTLSGFTELSSPQGGSRPLMVKSKVPSTFAERLEFARDRQRLLGTWVADQALAAEIGVSRSQFSDDKNREVAPSAERTLALARICGVDPGWLSFGEDTAAPAPDGFSTWFENRRAPRLAMKQAKTPGATRKRA